MSGGDAWSNDDDAELRRMDGWALGDAGRRLGRTEDAVRHRARLLGMGVEGGILRERKRPPASRRPDVRPEPVDTSAAVDEAITASLRKAAEERRFYG